MHTSKFINMRLNDLDSDNGLMRSMILLDQEFPVSEVLLSPLITLEYNFENGERIQIYPIYRLGFTCNSQKFIIALYL